jgi:hypothetical protein
MHFSDIVLKLVGHSSKLGRAWLFTGSLCQLCGLPQLYFNMLWHILTCRRSMVFVRIVYCWYSEKPAPFI